jgi:hypothetical protein
MSVYGAVKHTRLTGLRHQIRARSRERATDCGRRWRARIRRRSERFARDLLKIAAPHLGYRRGMKWLLVGMIVTLVGCKPGEMPSRQPGEQPQTQVPDPPTAAPGAVVVRSVTGHGGAIVAHCKTGERLVGGGCDGGSETTYPSIPVDYQPGDTVAAGWKCDFFGMDSPVLVSYALCQGVAPGSAVPAPSAPPDRCADIRARFRATYAARTDACTTDSDCGCWAPVGGPEMHCGGVTDATTAAKLADIEREFHAASCAWTHQCAAWACRPRCVASRCSSNPS